MKPVALLLANDVFNYDSAIAIKRLDNIFNRYGVTVKTTNFHTLLRC
jgi:hypothetical protein